MKQSQIKRRTPMKQGGPLALQSDRQKAKLRASGEYDPFSTFRARKPPLNTSASKTRRHADTGPKQSTRDTVSKRSGGMCEWPDCPQRAVHKHHRLDRGMGGAHGAARVRINQPAWLLDVCLSHHEFVTNPVGADLKLTKDWGWVLVRGQDALHVPAMTRHHGEPVWLDNDGGWHRYEDGAA